MKIDYRTESPKLLRDFLAYHGNIKGQSPKTIDEYFLDMRMYFRYLKRAKGLVPADTPFDEISILDVELALVRDVTLSDIYDYMAWLSRDRETSHTSADPSYGIGAAARARKVASIRSFYKYLTTKAHLLEENPIQGLDSPKLRKSLPKYLTLDESVRLLQSVQGDNQARDYCILILFLNCGLRISELVSLNLRDIQEDTLRVTGKGNKQRVVFLNDACLEALKQWLAERSRRASTDPNALFITRQHGRISTAAVHKLVKKHLSAAGLDSSQYSSHKLRHTAATLMLHNGVDVRTLQELLGHEHLNTTQIYTHVGSEDLRTAAKTNPLSSVKPPKAPLPADPDENEE